MKRKPIQPLLIAATLMFSLLLARGIQAQGDSTTTVINTVNQLRVGKGLPALLVHPALLEIAQQHSQYQASLGFETAEGEDGSTVKDRAEEAGFGIGTDIFVFENEACGSDMTITEIMAERWVDPPQLETLYNPEAQYIGAGVAYAGDLVCYTVVTGYWIGQPLPSWTVPPPAGTPGPSVIPTAVPVMISTPGADGTVKHTVAGGQTLWIIAAVYNIPLEEVRALNGFGPDTVVNPGDVVIMRPSYTPTNTPIGKPSPTLPPRFTHTPSPSGFQGTALVSASSPTIPAATATAAEPRFRTTAKNPTVVIIAVLISGGTLAAVLLFSIKDRD